MGTWMNSDGLYQKFGVTRATVNTGGEYETDGHLREVEFKITLADLTETETVLSDNVFIPSGARIVEVDILTHTAAATGTAIDVGLIKTDRTTEIDYNGLVAAFVTATMDATGERSILKLAATIPTGLTGTGALVGTTTSNVGYVTASRTDATAFTAGIIYLTIRYYIP